jgi:hypothetical protein
MTPFALICCRLLLSPGFPGKPGLWASYLAGWLCEILVFGQFGLSIWVVTAIRVTASWAEVGGSGILHQILFLTQ